MALFNLLYGLVMGLPASGEVHISVVVLIVLIFAYVVWEIRQH